MKKSLKVLTLAALVICMLLAVSAAQASSKILNESLLRQPAAPSVENHTTGVRVEWDSVRNAKKYEVWVSYDGSSYWKADTVTKTHYTFYDLKPLHDMRFCIRAVNGNYVSRMGKKSALIVQVPSTKVSSVSASSYKHSITAKIKLLSCDVDGYQVQYATKSSFGGICGSKWLDDDERYATFKGLTARKRYYVRVRALYYDYGHTYKSSWSDGVSVTAR